MEQTNNVALNLLQTVVSQTQLPRTGKSDGDSDFQKLLDKAKSGQPDSEVEQPKTDKPAAAQKPEKAPAQVKKSPAEETQEQSPWVVVGQLDPSLLQPVTVEMPDTGEKITLMTGNWIQDTITVQPWQETAARGEGEGTIPVAQSQVMDVSDPEADAILEATDPTVEHGPAQMLEKLADEVAGVKEEKEPQLFQTQAADGDKEAEVEIIDADQGPQQLFHDVKAAPVKVGEIYQPEQAEKADVAQQIDTGLAQALEQGESMVRIQLTPENLGSVTVEITRSAEGIIRVALSAHSTETRGLLERHAGELQGLLTNRTQQDVEVNVQHNQEGQQGQNQQNPYDGRSGHGQSGQEGRRQSRREQPEHGQDFMQQLRLGLIPTDE